MIAADGVSEMLGYLLTELSDGPFIPPDPLQQTAAVAP